MSTTFHKHVKAAAGAAREQARLKRLLDIALTRVAEAELIGWPALAASWEADVQRILSMVDAARKVER